MKVNDVVQFNENNKWCGCLGIISEVKELSNNTRYMVGVPIPQQGIAYVYVMESDEAIEYIGKAKLVGSDNEE